MSAHVNISQARFLETLREVNGYGLVQQYKKEQERDRKLVKDVLSQLTSKFGEVARALQGQTKMLEDLQAEVKRQQGVVEKLEKRLVEDLPVGQPRGVVQPPKTTIYGSGLGNENLGRGLERPSGCDGNGFKTNNGSNFHSSAAAGASGSVPWGAGHVPQSAEEEKKVFETFLRADKKRFLDENEVMLRGKRARINQISAEITKSRHFGNFRKAHQLQVQKDELQRSLHARLLNLWKIRAVAQAHAFRNTCKFGVNTCAWFDFG